MWSRFLNFVNFSNNHYFLISLKPCGWKSIILLWRTTVVIRKKFNIYSILHALVHKVRNYNQKTRYRWLDTKNSDLAARMTIFEVSKPSFCFLAYVLLFLIFVNSFNQVFIDVFTCLYWATNFCAPYKYFQLFCVKNQSKVCLRSISHTSRLSTNRSSMILD